jgi:hypothetical protein
MIRYATTELAAACSKIENDIYSNPKFFDKTVHMNASFVAMDGVLGANNDWSGITLVSLLPNGSPIGRILFDGTFGTLRVIRSVGMFGYSSFLPLSPEQRLEADLTWKNDLLSAINLVFMKHDVWKIRFCVFVGNHAQRHYRFIVKRSGGAIVGLFKKETQLRNGEMVDQENYELYKDAWVAAVDAGKIKVERF